MRITKINNDEDDQILNFGCPLTTNFWIEFCYSEVACSNQLCMFYQ